MTRNLNEICFVILKKIKKICPFFFSFLFSGGEGGGAEGRVHKFAPGSYVSTRMAMDTQLVTVS